MNLLASSRRAGLVLAPCLLLASASGGGAIELNLPALGPYGSVSVCDALAKGGDVDVVLRTDAGTYTAFLDHSRVAGLQWSCKFEKIERGTKGETRATAICASEGSSAREVFAVQEDRAAGTVTLTPLRRTGLSAAKVTVSRCDIPRDIRTTRESSAR